MQAQARFAQVSQGLGLFVVAAALLIGAAGGYALRGIGFPLSGVEAAPAAADTSHTILIPRSVREDTDITPIQAPAPRWTHEDDVPTESQPPTFTRAG